MAGAPDLLVDSITMIDYDQMTFCNSLSVDRYKIIQIKEKINGSESTKSCSSSVKSWKVPQEPPNFTLCIWIIS